MSEHEPTPSESKQEERRRKERERLQAWRAANREKYLDTKRAWAAGNREKIRAQNAGAYRKRPTRITTRAPRPIPPPPGNAIPGLPDDKIRVSRDGSVWTRRSNRRSWRKLKGRTRRRCPTVQYSINGQLKEFTVASLVCRAFHGPRPLGNEPFHYPDPDTLNCHADNLRWAPRGTHNLGRRPRNSKLENLLHFGSSHPQAVFIEEDVQELRRLRKDGWSIRELGREFNVSKSTVSDIVLGRTWSHVPDLEGEARS